MELDERILSNYREERDWLLRVKQEAPTQAIAQMAKFLSINLTIIIDEFKSGAFPADWTEDDFAKHLADLEAEHREQLEALIE